MKTNKVRITLYGKILGYLVWDSRKNVGMFLFDEAFRRESLEPFPIIFPKDSAAASLPFYGEAHRGDRFSNLPPFLADFLPDGWSSRVFDDWAARHNIPPSSRTPADKLSFIGKRSIGALEFFPQTSLDDSPETFAIEYLVKEADNLFKEKSGISLGSDDTLTRELLYKVGTSVGGQRSKALIAINDSTGEIRSGQIAGMDGFTYYILKFDEKEYFQSGVIEKTFADMAAACGINIPSARFVEVEGTRHFAIERFDRPGGRKVHTLTLASVSGGCSSYEDFVAFARRLCLPETSVSEIYRRMCFNVLSGNTDDHDRNFSFIMDENGVWSLAPAYDITFTNDIFSPSPTPRAMSVCGKRHGISMDDLKSFARKEGIVDSGHILTQVADTVARFEEFAKRNDMQPHWRSRIGNDIRENLSYNKANATVATSFQIDGQCCVDKVYVKESEKGVVEFGCLIDSIRCRKFFQPESEIAKVFRNLGMEFMPAADMERLAIQLLVFPYIGHESTSDVSVHLHEKMTCDRKTDVVDDSGRSVLPHPVDAIASASDGFALVRNDGKFNFADVDTCSSGWCPRFLLETWADWAFSFHNGTAHVVYDGKHMIVARDGSLTMEDLTPPRPKLR